jgi:alkylation response protein AidB-like acyl-CoA dehydrogenase
MADLRAEVREWLGEQWSPDLTLREWWRRLADAGFAFPSFPKGHGGLGLSAPEARVVAEELTRAGAIAAPFGLGQIMGAPVVLDHGTDEQKDAWVLNLAAGVESWCQLFSEPGAGSDLASSSTRAVRDGDVWVVNGQKVWTSGAQVADRGMLVARTNVDNPKHRGLTYFIIDIDQPGIEVRPLKQMNGAAHFNEVFFNDAVVGNDRVIGSVNDGWMVAVATLAYERQGLTQGGRGGIAAGAPGERAGQLDRTCGELLARAEQPAMATNQRTRATSALRELAETMGKTADPVMRQRLAAHHSLSEAQRLSGLRARAAAQKGKQPGPAVSTAKLVASELGRQSRDVAMDLLGPSGMLMGDDTVAGGEYQQMALSVQSSSIAGGTDEIQRNIIGERVLGLPKEPQVDRDVPFRELKTGTQRPPG